jgi:hypothetical protein
MGAERFVVSSMGWNGMIYSEGEPGGKKSRYL